MVFYSLESKSGSVRIKLGARDVPSPVSDSVFSVNCDRTVSRSVSISYTDGTRMPVVLKEALLDPETDLSGIQRDYGSHISSVAEVLSMLDCHPVFTEGSSGTTLNTVGNQGEEPSRRTADLALKLAETAGVDPGYILVDLPIEAVKVSEERFTRLDIKYLDRTGEILPLDRIDPPFAEYLSKSHPNSNYLTVCCSPELREKVRKACEDLFHLAAMPLFPKN